MMPSRWGPIATGAFFLVIAVLWATFVSRATLDAAASPLDRLESVLLDIRYTTFGPIDPSPDVVVVAIDDVTLDSMRGAFPDNRLLLAGVVRAIADANPKVLGLDVILADAGDPEGDARLASALAQTQTVIAAAGRFSNDPSEVRAAQPDSVLRPHERFQGSATTGLVNLSTDAGGTPRYVPVVFRTPQGVEPAFALHVASAFKGMPATLKPSVLQLGDREIPLDVGLNMPLRLVGPTESIPTYSAMDVVSGVVAEELEGKAVILGYTATAFGDRFPNPFDENVPGAEIIATAVSQMLDGRILRRDATTRRVDAAAGVVVAVLAALLVLTLPLSIGVPLALGGLAFWVMMVWYAFSQGVWLSASIPIASASVPVLAAASWRYFDERRVAARGAQALAALKQFQSPALAEMIAGDRTFLQHPTATQLSVFFVDLSSFTKLSEKLGSEATQDLLKQFHQRTARVIQANNGIVLNYMGDGALAIFGVTGTANAGTRDAMQAAFELARDIETLGPGMARDLYVGCRIGLHHGEVILSRLGGDQHQQVSVAGDTVNLASRLLEIAKEQGAVIAATDVVVQLTDGSERLSPGWVKSMEVRGRESTALVHFWAQQDLR